jgi:hypothetical protein
MPKGEAAEELAVEMKGEAEETREGEAAGQRPSLQSPPPRP